MHKQFTSTVFILQDERVLLIHHRKLKTWLPPGGHLDPDETPPDGAIREALEETGLEIELLRHENIWIDRRDAKSFERPYMCLLESIPAIGKEPAHQHMDLIYVGTPIGGEEKRHTVETSDMRWFTLEEIEALRHDDEIFEDTKQIIRQIFADKLTV